MKLSLLTWNSININSAEIKSTIPVGQLANLSANAVTVNRAGDYPFLSDTQLPAHIFVIEVYIVGGANINTNREALKGYFNVMDRSRHNLVAQDENDSNRQYYLTGLPIGFSSQGENKPNAFNVRFQVEYPYWRLVTATVDSWDITATGDSDAVTNIGNIKVPPVFTITPLTTKTAGLKYRRYVSIRNALDKSFVAPLDIADGQLDAPALIDAGKVISNGNDFRVWMDGSFADRFLGEFDSDSDPARVWVNYDLEPRKSGSLLSTFDSDDTTMYFTQSKDNLTFLQSMKRVSNKTLLIDSEIVLFVDSDVDVVEYTINNVSRGQKNTTAASHVAASATRHIQHDLWMLYGDSDLGSPNPTTNLDFSPIFDKNTSTNSAWIYTNYFDTGSNRPGAWKGEVQSSKTNLSYTFTGNENTRVNPSTELGLAMRGGGDFQIANEAGTLSWLFSHPSGITDVTYSGEVYNTGSWPAIVGLQYLQPNAVWFTVQQETEPTLAQTWQAFGPHVVSLGDTYETIRHVIDGQLDSVINEMALVQFDTHTITFDSDNLPVISVGNEESTNFFDFKLTNNTTGEYIKVQTPCPLNTALTIDCENKIAYLADGGKVNVIFSSDRGEWLDLVSGVNNLQYDDVGTVSVNIVITHRDRNL